MNACPQILFGICLHIGKTVVELIIIILVLMPTLLHLASILGWIISVQTTTVVGHDNPKTLTIATAAFSFYHFIINSVHVGIDGVYSSIHDAWFR